MNISYDEHLLELGTCYDVGINFKATGDSLIIAPMFISEKKHIDEIIDKLRTGILTYSKNKKN